MRRRLRSAAFPIHRHALPQLALDAGLVALAYYLAYRLRFDGGIPRGTTPTCSGARSRSRSSARWSASSAVGMYRHWMRYSSQREYLKIAEGVVLAVLALIGYVAVVQPQLISTGSGFVARTIPTGVLVLFGLLLGAFLTGTRFLVHLLYQRALERLPAAPRRALGADRRRRQRRPAAAAASCSRTRELGYRPVGFVDDDPKKQGMAEVLRHDRRPRRGARRRRARRGDDRDPVGARHAARRGRQRLPRARHHRCARCRPSSSCCRPAATSRASCATCEIEDVLGRDPVRMEIESVGGYLTGRRVLVTGAGGSIGSELCRQIARVNPSQLVLLDNSEANLFEIERELRRRAPRPASPIAVLADVQGRGAHARGVRRAPAGGRVPRRRLQARRADGGTTRSRPCATTRSPRATLTKIAGESGARRVRARLDRQGGRPGDGHGRVQGARRVGRGGRQRALSRTRRSAPCASATCSAPPARWCRSSAARSQAGGPVTVTDPEMTRFFMTIPEAVQLVIRSGSLAQGGEVYALDMGDPVADHGPGRGR